MSWFDVGQESEAYMSEWRRYGCDVHTHTLYSRHAYSTVDEIDFPPELIATRSADAFRSALGAAGLNVTTGT